MEPTPYSFMVYATEEVCSIELERGKDSKGRWVTRVWFHPNNAEQAAGLAYELASCANNIVQELKKEGY